MQSYEELAILGPDRNRKNGESGIPFDYSPRLKKFLNPISQGQYYAVGGRASGGKRSFTDLHFVMGAFINWYRMPPETRPPLKIIYYNMEKSPKQKLQKMLCTYLWIYRSQLMDINTLNGMSSRMFDIGPGVEALINESSGFFHEFFKITDMRHGPTSPSALFTDVVKYMNTIGTEHHEGDYTRFEYAPGYENQITLVIVDDVKKMKMVSKGGNQNADTELHNSLNNYLVQLRDIYRATPVAVVPSWEVPGNFRLNQMTPDFREFKYYFDDCNVVIHLFNPYRFEIMNYQGWDTTEYISTGDNIPRFRVCSILKNTDAGDSSQVPLLFIPENGMFMDLPKKYQEKETLDTVKYAKEFKQTQIAINTHATDNHSGS